MAVIPFPMDLAPQGPSPRMSWELRSLTARHVSPLSGVATTLERPGAHWAASLPYENLADDRRARLQTFAASCRGHASRFYVPVFGWTLRGSISAPELLTNNTFASGTTGLTAGGSFALTASDGVLRATRTQNTGATNGLFRNTTALAVTQYAPYLLRAIVANPIRRTPTDLRLTAGSTAFGTEYRQVTGFGLGLLSMTFVPSGTSAFVDITEGSNTAAMAGDAVAVPWWSVARCALVDNGQNLLVRSDAFDNASWGVKSNATVSADATAAPDGSTTADAIVEASDTGQVHEVGQHGVTFSSAVADYSFAVALKAAGRTWARVSMQEGSANDALAYFDLQNGVLGAVSTDGAGWTDVRAFMRSLGNGWYYCCVVGRKASAATDIDARVIPAEANNDITYDGNGAASIYAWRATLAQSGVPVRLTATTTTAVASGTLQTGGALHLKGLPSSTNGLLLQGDPVEIITGTTSQLVRVRGSLNSDAAGLGYMQFEPPLRVSPSDSAGVIVQNPLCKMMADSNNAGWTDRAAGFSDLELSFVEDTYPS